MDATVDAATGRLDQGRPDMAQPDMPPDMARPDATPDMRVPDMASPDMASPDMASPDMASPDMASPDMASPDMALDMASDMGCDPGRCGPDEVCGPDGGCVPRCTAGECGDGHCGPLGTCLEGPCVDDESCGADAWCGPQGQCAVGCRIDGCDADQRCDLDTRACVACAPEVCGNAIDEDCDGTLDDPDVCGCEPADEICDGRDNDCDGATDEAFPALNMPCPGGEGVCAGTGRWACEGGEQICAGIDAAAMPETCDALDNDCDGSTDEGFDLGTPCMVGDGVCAAAGQTRCTADGAGTECDAQPGVAGVEACNGADDDCDGRTDEDWPDLGAVCVVGDGICQAEGVVECTPDGAACTAVPGAARDEICNGADDDCDGRTDEGPDGQPIVAPCYEGPAGTEGVGLCQGGQATCDGGFFGACVGQVRPAAEACDTLDNDCNGVPDDAPNGCDCAPDSVRDCYTGPAGTDGVGACRAGTQTCAADGSGWGACVGQITPAEEVCGGGDEDCDGTIDNAPGVGDVCSAGQGACAVDGVRICQAGAVVCDAQAGAPGDEICNAIDDDCDGTTDENTGGAACSDGQGECARDGVQVCAGGELTCNAEAGVGAPELCNGLDDDCDGSTDESFDLGAPCQIGDGLCVSNGVQICDPAGGVLCDAPPPVGSIEECNGLDDDCDDAIDEDTCIVDDEPPVVDLQASQLAGNPGTRIRITVNAVDNVGVVACSLTINGEPVALDANCEVRYTFNDSGPQRLVGTARDAAGNEASDDALIRVFAPDDVDSPTVRFVAPRRGSNLNTPTVVTGTVQDANLLEWEFTWGPEGDTAANFIARGDTTLDVGELGVLPAHTMPVGEIFMRLSAVDINGRRRTTTRLINIVDCVPQIEVCDGFDNDCDDAIDEGGFDCNDNNVNDACELADGRLLDCDNNSVPDACDIAAGRRNDCDANGIPDRCDIAAGAADCDADGVPDRCGDECAPDVTPPTIDLVVHDVDLGVDPGVPTRVTVLGDDDVGVDTCALFINDAPVALNEFCRVDHVFPAPGFYTLRGVVRDAAGNEATESTVLRVFDPADLDIPELSITTPVEAAVINAAGPVEIVGSIQDPNLVSWRLTYGPVGQPEDTLLAEGDADVIDQVLAQLDPAALPNGAYELRLQAIDINFREQVLLRPFSVDICRPTGDEICDGIDNNCDGRIDEGEDDCDLNGISDACDIGAGRVPDCNGNGVPDSCDIGAGLEDCDNDGRPDVCDDACVADVTPPIADLFVGGEIVNAGTPVQIVVRGQDNVGVVECLATVDGVALPLDANCQAIYNFPNPGFVTVEGIVRDAAGNQGVDSAQVRVLDPNDVEPPTVALTSPAPGAQLSAATTIIGTVQDPNLVAWTTSYGPVGNGDANLIAQGDAPVNNGPLGVIDVANIAVGDYELRLVAEDVNGRGRILTSPFSVGVCEPGPEVCDGADNDCDRSTDEGFDGLGEACTAGLGICARQGVTRCFVDGSGTGCDATPGQPEAVERCDNLDRDCDGSPTNGFNVGAPCTVGQGICARDGVMECTAEGDGVACNAVAGAPGNEICDHLDNDCDGVLDEGFPGVQCGQGQCQRFLANCPGDPPPACDPFEGATLERCNGLDDDCDGQIDEDAAGTGDPCSIGLGACAADGVTTCVDAAIACDAEIIPPGVEECDPIDNDCDGLNDEGGVCPDEDPPLVNIALDVQLADPGQPVTITVQAQDDSGIASVVVTVDGVPLPVNNGPGGYQATFQTDTPGVYQVEVTVTDSVGNPITETAQIRVRDNADNVAPVVNIVRPTVDQLVPEKTEVEATIVDDNFFEYVVRMAPVDTDDWLEIARARTQPADDILGVIDATLLVNGLYRVQVLAEDVNGRIGLAEVVVNIEGNAKIGLFTITYTDMSVPVAGMPLTVERTYDSRVKTAGDFGVGWSLKVKQGKFEHNRDQAEGWEFVRGGGFLNFPCQGGAVEDGVHTTELRVADKERYAFRLRAHNSGAIQGGCQGFADYEFVFGTIPGEARLEIIGNNSFLYLNQDQRLHTHDLSGDFTIDRVRLTTPDKRVFDFGKDEDGVFRLEDKNANQVSIQHNGLIHSAGKSVTFERDGQGRITAVVAPNGQRRTYEYDARGDLVAATDQLGNVTRYTYDTRHNLQDIVDPSGNTPARQIYDDDGRLIAIEYGDGERLEMDHDLDNRVEVARDRLGNVEIFEYDARGNVLSHTDKAGHTTTNVFNAEDRPTLRTEPGGGQTVYVYDDLGRMTALTNPLGHQRSAEYNAQNKTTRAVDFNGNVTLNVYDDNGNLTQTTDALGNVWQYTYDARGNRTQVTDPAGNLTRTEYNNSGYAVRVIDALGNAITSTYDANGNRLTETRMRGDEAITTRYAYDANDRVIRTTDALGGVIAVEFDERGRKVAEVDSRGFRTVYEWDDAGNNIGVVYADGSRAENAFDAEGRRIRSTDRTGATTRYEYDAMGRVVRTLLPDGGVLGAAYDGRGNLIRETDERGNETAHEYDLANRRVRTTDALGRVTEYGYDALGNRISQTGPDGAVWRYEFDGLNRQTAIVFPDGARQTSTYDAQGRKLSETDANGLTVQWSYDALGRLISVIDPAGGETTYTYDALGNQISQTDANGRTTTFTHDALGRVTSKTLPGGETMSAEFDPMGNMIARTDYNGQRTAYVYDSNGRLTDIELPEGDTERATWTPEGKRRTVIDARGETTWTYDSRGRVTGRTDPDGVMLQWEYDASGNRTALVSPDGRTEYTYDALNRLITVTDPQGGVTRYAYHDSGARSSLTLPNGVVTTYTYDATQRLTGVETRDAADEVVAGYVYTLDAGGRRVALDEAHTGRHVDYTYDALSRLIEEDIVGERTISYTYDAVGNRLTRTDSVDGQTAYTYDINDRIQTVGALAYTHDANGNVTGIGDAAFTFDSRNRLILADRDGVTSSYTYDLDGHRVAQVVDEAGALSETRYIVDENRNRSEVLAETDAEGNTQVAYVYGAEVISQRRGAAESYYLADGQMSVRQLVDGAGAVSDSYTYDAFGGLLTTAGDTENALLYNGQFLDANTGFYYLRARWLDPDTGRFQSMDPVEGKPQDPRTLHRYTYAFNSPVDMSDPSGRFTMVSVSISLSINLNLRSIYTTNLVKTFLRVTRVAFCQLAPAYAARNAALDGIGSNAPGSWDLLAASQTMISKAFKAIGDATAQFYSDVAGEIVDFKVKIDVDLNAAIDALQAQLGPGFGGFNAGVDDAQSILQKIEQLQAWKEKVDSFMDTAKDWYDTAATLIDSGNTATACDKAKAWEKVGNKLLDFVPSF